MDRVYQRDAVLAAYSITKDEQLELILAQEEGNVEYSMVAEPPNP